MSDTPKDDTAKAEPVDAEFEPAPGSPGESGSSKADRAGSKTAKPAKGDGKGLPWLTIALVTVFAGAIGGGSGYLIGKHGPDPARSDLEARLAALEAAEDDTATADQLASLTNRLADAEAQLDGAQLRSDGIEQLVRDVASLRDRLEALEAAPAQSSPGLDNAGDALAALEQEFNSALAALRDRLNTLTSDTETARSIAEQARSSLQQAMNLLSQRGAEEGGNDAAPNAASATALSAIEARVGSLEGALQRLDAQGAQLRRLQDTVTSLSNAEAPTTDLEPLRNRVRQLEASLAALTAPAPQVAAPPASVAERALAFAAVSRSAAGSEPFPVPVANLRRLWPGAPALNALAEPARTGAPTLDQLTTRFPADAIRAATGEAQMLFGVIRVEREGTTGPTPAIEAALEAGDLATAVTATRALQGEARTVAASWLAQAEARLAIEQSLERLAEALSRLEESEG